MTDTEIEVKMEAPPAFRKRCVIRCTKAELARTKKTSEPMVKTMWECCGLFENGVLKPSLMRGNIEYRIAGLDCNGIYGGEYFPLMDNTVDNFRKFYELATGNKLPKDFDRENPPIEFLDGLLMEATVHSVKSIQTEGITEEEKAAKIERGEKPVGEPLKDSEGNTLERTVLAIAGRDAWGKRWTKDVPEPY